MAIELSRQEFAYVLAAVEASSILGVDEAKLFPTTPQGRTAAYRKGRELLEANGWITPVKEHEGEHELAAELYHLAAVISEASYVVATTHGETKKKRRLALHYLEGDYIVELWGTKKGSYILSFIDDRESLASRVAAVLGIEPASQPAQFSMDNKDFKKLVTHAQKGEQDKAAGLLKVNGKLGGSLVEAFAAGEIGEVVVVQAKTGEFEAGQRASIYGAGDSAWMVWRAEAGSKELEVSVCDADRIGQYISEWMDRHSK